MGSIIVKIIQVLKILPFILYFTKKMWFAQYQQIKNRNFETMGAFCEIDKNLYI